LDKEKWQGMSKMAQMCELARVPPQKLKTLMKVHFVSKVVLFQ
jgi:hypothetical protein